MTVEFDVSDDDIEKACDKALGLSENDSPSVTRNRLMKKGITLSAKQLVSDRRKKAFIVTLAQTGIVSRATAAAGWPRGYAYDVRKTDEEFAELWNQALEFATDTLEEAARIRAVEGVSKPVYQQKELVGHVTEYSDTLLALLLKAKRPKEFRENFSIDAEVKGGVLIVPGMASDKSWEDRASINQANYRVNGGDID